MNIITTIKSAVGRMAGIHRRSALTNLGDESQESAGVGAVTTSASFDAARSSPSRSSTTAFPINSYREINEYDRRAIVQKHRAVRNSLPVVNGLIKTGAELALGIHGLQPIPASTDDKFNKRALAYHTRWARGTGSDRRGMANHATQQMIIAQEVFTDGEIFRERLITPRGHMRQMHKTEQVFSLYGATSIQGHGWVNGILYDEALAPIRYRINLMQLPGMIQYPGSHFIERDANMIQHIFEMERAPQGRGLPWGYSGINDCVSAIDIKCLENAAFAINAAIVGALTTPTGQVPKSMAQLISQQESAQGMAPSEIGSSVSAQQNNDTTAENVRYLDVHGTMIPLFKLGENMQFFNQNRSLNPVEFITWLFRGYAAGYGLPFDIVWGMAALGSAATRGMTQMAGRFIDRVQRLMINSVCQPDYEDVIGLGMMAYMFPKDFPLIEPLEPPKDISTWNMVDWGGPPDPSIDLFRDGKMAMDLISAGLMTVAEWRAKVSGNHGNFIGAYNDEVVTARKDWLDKGLPEEMFWRQRFPSLPSTVTQATDPNAFDDEAEIPDAKVEAIIRALRERNVIAAAATA